MAPVVTVQRRQPGAAIQETEEDAVARRDSLGQERHRRSQEDSRFREHVRKREEIRLVPG